MVDKCNAAAASRWTRARAGEASVQLSVPQHAPSTTTHMLGRLERQWPNARADARQNGESKGKCNPVCEKGFGRGQRRARRPTSCIRSATERMLSPFASVMRSTPGICSRSWQPTTKLRTRRTTRSTAQGWQTNRRGGTKHRIEMGSAKAAMLAQWMSMQMR
eukprot:809082-Pleurochrysis_carterae.AAC.2